MGRTLQNLNLNWKFHRGDEPEAWYKGFDDSGWQDVTLPHDWSVTEPFSREYSSGTGYLPGGTGWYRKSFSLPETARNKRVTVTFDGVYNNAQVWCNSYYLGKRPYGYSSFTYDISDFVNCGGSNVVSVKVNHKELADSRWFTGSGIYRDVTLAVTDRIHFDNYGIFATTPEVSESKATVAVHIRLSNESQDDAELLVNSCLLDDEHHSAAAEQDSLVLQQGGAKTLELTLTVPNPRLWSPDTPYLYSLRTEIVRNGVAIDQVITPIGIRWFEFDADHGFFLNGSNIKIKGVCIHHDAGCLGAAVPAKVWIGRLEALKDMGCNAIRMSHNPPSPKLLDLCDRMGFLVMDEAFDEWEGVKNKWSTGHNVYPPKHYGYFEEFPQWGETDLKDMVLRDRNHPSIILWSIGNEVDYPNDPYCHPSFRTMTGNNDANKPAAEREYDPNKPNAEHLAAIARRLVHWVKECDTTRPVTAAVAFPELSNLTGYTEALDIVGYNYKEHLYGEDHIKYPGRVIYGSENSSSLEAWLAVRDNEYCCAQFIWTGIDYLGEAKGWPVRASQSGFLDLAGNKKAEYFYRRSLWSSEPMVFLTTRRTAGPAGSDNNEMPYGTPHWNWIQGEKIEVLCFTNCEEAELFVNGKSAGSKRLSDFPSNCIKWEIAFETGTLSAKAKSSDGRDCCFELKTSSVPEKVELKTGAAGLTADGQDIAQLDVSVLDHAGQPVYLSDNLIALSVTGPGEIIGLENGDASDLEPYSSKQRKVYHGRLTAYIRSRPEEGQIVIRAESKGLEPAFIVIDTHEAAGRENG